MGVLELHWSCSGAAMELALQLALQLALELQWSYQDRAAGTPDPQPTPIPRHSRRDGGSSSAQGSSTLPVTEQRGAVRSPEHFREDL